MNHALRDKIIHFPHQPGCYLFKDTTGLVLYVGKAKDLRKRVSQYFGQDKRPQLPFLIEDASDIDYIVARSELEALFLENTLIKKHNPKYNIKLKDDKNYAFIAIDYSTQIPQIGYVRKITDTADFTPFVNPSASWGSGKRESKVFKPKATSRNTLSLRGGLATKQSQSEIQIAASRTPRNDNFRLTAQDSRLKTPDYFGPYSSVKKIRETLDFVRRIFPYCANTEVGSRPCFYYHLHRCPGVCIGAVTLEEYQKNLSRIKLFLNGKTTEIKKELKASMEQAARVKRFELAARLRDQLRALEILDDRQIAQFPTKVDYDLISLATQNHLRCVNLFKVRGGKLTDKENFIYAISTPTQETNMLHIPYGREKSESRKVFTAQDGDVLQSFAETYYAETTDIPGAVFIQYPLPNSSLLLDLLKLRKGRKANLSTPHRGKAHQLIKLGQVNAEECLRKTLATDATDADKIHEALRQLQELLTLPKLPKRIECYDMSNTQGTNPVGSMVVFVDGRPAKSEYRKFKIRSKDTPDDFAMMRETLVRRLRRLNPPLLEGEMGGVTVNNANNQDIKNPDHSTASPGPSSRGGEQNPWPRPDLMVIDGGKGQLSAALEAQDSVLQATSYKLQAVPMIGLAKRIEEIFTPNSPEPIVLGYDHPSLQLLQRLRDEAHRFGITFHRSLRSKQATRSALDIIPGIGPKTKKLLKQKFGTISAIKKIAAEKIEELEKLVGKAKADIIKKNL